MAREKVDNKLNVIIGTKAQIEGDTSIPENSIIVVTDEELQADEIVYSVEKNVKEAIDDLETSKQDKLIAGDNITIDENTNTISASSSGGEVDLNEMAYFDYAGSIYGDRYNLLENAWEHSLTVDPLEISENSTSSNYQGIAQYPNGETEGVIIPQGVTNIGQFAFRAWTANNQPLVIPNSVTSIGGAAFINWTSNTQPLVIPNSVTSIGTQAFQSWSSNNQPLVIPSSVTSISYGAFNGWSANNQPLIIPNSVTSIGTQAFQYWSSNNQPLVIPSSVTSISNNAFNNWFLVPYVEMKRTTPPTLANANAFDEQNNAPIYVPDGSVNAYKTATNWVDLADRIFPISDKPDLADLQENKQDRLVAGENITIDENTNTISASGGGGDNYININYADLVALRDSNSLKEGAFYRITDYETTTVQAETQSAGHQFDIIVQALDEKTLSENASAIHRTEGLPSWFEHDESDPAERFFYVDSVVIAGLTLYRWLSVEESNNDSGPQYLLTETRNVDVGDVVWGWQTIDDSMHGDFLDYEDGDPAQRTINNVDEGYIPGDEPDDYFANSKLEAWELKYCLDNDTNRFAWADDVNGKGVIYRMIDEFNNDVPYDFKNIQFLRDGVYYFTFTWITEDDTIWDASIHPELTNDEGEGSRVFNNIISSAKNYSYILNNNVFIADYDTDGGFLYGWYSNIAKDNFVGNTIGDSFFGNTIGNDFYNNTIESFFTSNTTENIFYNNTIGNGFYNNTIGNNFYNNTIGNSFATNTIGDGFFGNTIGDDFYNNTIGIYFNFNTIENIFHNNTIGNNFYNSTIGNYFNASTIGNDVRYIQLSLDGTSGNRIRYLYLKNGLSGASNANKLDLYYAGLYHREYPTTFELIENGSVISTWEATPLTRIGKVKATNTTATWSDISGGGGGWTEVWSGDINLNNLRVGYTGIIVPPNNYVGKRIAIEVQYGAADTTYTSKIIFGVLGSDTTSAPSTFMSKGIGWSYFDGTYLRIKTLYAYASTGNTTTIYVGNLKTLFGSFSDSTIEWSTSYSETLYMRKIWVIE